MPPVYWTASGQEPPPAGVFQESINLTAGDSTATNLFPREFPSRRSKIILIFQSAIRTLIRDNPHFKIRLPKMEPKRIETQYSAADLSIGWRAGVHTARTIMLREISTMLEQMPPECARSAFEKAVVQDNILGKATVSSRKRTFEHLVSLYALDPAVPTFRLLRHLWRLDPTGRPLICLVAARARDSLLQLGTDFILPLALGTQYDRPTFETFISERFPNRFSDKMRRSLAQNIASSFTQAGFLHGKIKKVRAKPPESIGAVTLALALNRLDNPPMSAWESPFFKILGLPRVAGESAAREASKRGWINYSQIGDVGALSFRHLASDTRVMELS